jgi:glycosyltransferase involved in cell wall biosynthesis
MCTFNSEEFIAAQLRSILEQSAPPLEIVVSDDGSTDRTAQLVREIFDEYLLPDTVLIYLPVDGESLGVTRNFERAISNCSGDLIALSDHDDVWHVDRLASAALSFEEDPHALVQHTDARLVDEDGAALGVSLFDALGVDSTTLTTLRSGGAFALLISRNLATGATMTVRSSFARSAMPFASGWVHDEWLAILAAAGNGLRVSAEMSIDYRQHGRNQIGVQKPTLRYRFSRMLEPRGQRYSSLALRADALLERLVKVQAEQAFIDIATAKARFERARAMLPRKRIARLPIIVREARAGHYGNLSSQGSLDVIRDLIQPP